MTRPRSQPIPKYPAAAIALAVGGAVFAAGYTLARTAFASLHARDATAVTLVCASLAAATAILLFARMAFSTFSPLHREFPFAPLIAAYALLVATFMYLTWEICTAFGVQYIANGLCTMGSMGALLGVLYLREKRQK